MNITTKVSMSIYGILGVLGGLTLFAGDMLFYYNGDSTDLLQNMAIASDTRIILSGIFALLATWLYLFGLVPVYYAFTPTKPIVRNTVVGTFAGILIAYGVVHGAYTAIAVSAKLAVNNDFDIQESSHLAIQVNNAIRMMVYPLFAVLSVIFIYQVWKKNTLFPKWMVFFFPLLPFLLRNIILTFLGGKWQVIIGGGYLNLMLVVFFLAVVVSLWQKQEG
jgi:hypothetical protein